MIVIEGDTLEADLKLCSLVLNDVGAYVYVKDINKKYVYANQLTESLFKDRFDSIIGHTDDELFDLETSTDIQDNDNKVLDIGIPIKKKEINFIKSTGEKRVYLSVKKPIYNKNKEIIGIMGTSTDISEIQSLQHELELQATTDHLTGLFNRRHYFELAERTFSESKRHNKPFSVIMLDIDFFKEINDEYGHPIGDTIIQFISFLVHSSIRKEDVLARVGGEEFSILLPNTDIKSAELIAEKIRLNIDSNNATGDWSGKIHPKISLGVASLTQDDINFHQIYTRSDKALYGSKCSGRNKVTIAELAY